MAASWLLQADLHLPSNLQLGRGEGNQLHLKSTFEANFCVLKVSNLDRSSRYLLPAISFVHSWGLRYNWEGKSLQRALWVGMGTEADDQN